MKCLPAKPGCGKYLIPRFDFILKEGESNTPKVVLANSLDRHEKTENSPHSLYANNSRPPSIHPAISSTVLRL
jgi:hypothetical protein